MVDYVVKDDGYCFINGSPLDLSFLCLAMSSQGQNHLFYVEESECSLFLAPLSLASLSWANSLLKAIFIKVPFWKVELPHPDAPHPKELFKSGFCVKRVWSQEYNICFVMKQLKYYNLHRQNFWTKAIFPVQHIYRQRNESARRCE